MRREDTLCRVKVNRQMKSVQKICKKKKGRGGETNVFILQMIKFNFPKSIGYLLLNNTRIKLNTTILKLMVTTNRL